MKERIKIFMQSLKNIPLSKKKEFFLVAALLVISGTAHAYNMFNFPYYENDEGVYMSQAWSFVTQGKLAPYTYWYDHSPIGWLMIAVWTKLTGGFFTFGMSVNTGRVFMLVLHLFSTYFLFKIAKRMADNTYAGIFAALVFALSPLGIYFQRRVLLDNMMIFWILLSIYLLLCFRKRLFIIVLSAIAFALSCLSKESAVFFFPVFLYLVYVKIDKRHRKLGFTLWLVIFGIICSLYPLYALLKGELFPMGSIFDTGGEHVSLIGTLLWQASRDGGSAWSLIAQWINMDRIIIFFGALFTFANLLLGIRKKYYGIASLLSLSYIAYLVRGGMVIEFYIVGVIPFLALNIGVFVSFLINKFKNIKVQRGIALGLFLTLCFCFTDEAKNIRSSLAGSSNLYNSNQTVSQVEAISWARKNVSSDKMLVIDDYGYIDLKDPHVSTVTYKNAHWYWKVAQDPEIRDYFLKDNWENIDYIFSTPQMDNDTHSINSPVLQNAIMHSKPFKLLWNDGWGVNIWKTYNPEQILQDSWESYKGHFITTDGRVYDPYNNNSTTSEGQSYALLRAVWIDDKGEFDKVLAWTNQNLKLKSNNLFAWSWAQDEHGEWRIKDEGSATDADQDIALALLFAHKKWGDELYLKQASGIIENIWQYEVANIKGKPYLTAGNWTLEKNEVVINPSYFSPYAYRIFKEVDPGHDWLGLIDTSYGILSESSVSKLGCDSTIGLPPNWLAINQSGEVMSAASLGNFSSDYSYDAIRIPWRVALDWKWYQEPRAKSYLESLKFLSSKWSTDKKIMASYSHDGKYFDNYEATEVYGGSLGYFIIADTEASREIYENKILGKYFEDENKSYWDDSKNYYRQNWAWFGTALYNNMLPNLWNK